MHVDHAAGSPTSSSSFAKYSVVSGVSSAGLTTTVQPAASAGAILRVAIASGKFHGVMKKHGPDRALRDDHPPGALGVRARSGRRCARASSENQRRNSPP